MWPFSRKRARAVAARELISEVVDIACEKWTYFHGSLPFKADVSLRDKISTFYVPFSEGLEQNIPELRDAPEGLVLMLIAKGIVKSGTHSRSEIEIALGAKLPD